MVEKENTYLQRDDDNSSRGVAERLLCDDPPVERVDGEGGGEVVGGPVGERVARLVPRRDGLHDGELEVGVAVGVEGGHPEWQFNIFNL